MKTLHSLTSRGRIRVFFESANAPKGAAEVEDGGKYPIFTDTRKALAGVMLATALVLGNNGNAQAQTTKQPTMVAANPTTAATFTDRTSTGILFSYVAEHPEAEEGLSDEDFTAFKKWERRQREIQKAKLNQAAIERRKKENELDQAAIAEDARIRRSPVGQWLEAASKMKNPPLPPIETQQALRKLASQNPPPNIILEARTVCEKLGLSYQR